MDFLELSKSRYSVLRYKKTPVPAELINKILEAGNAAPTACNFQPQKIKILQSDEDRARLNRVIPSSHYVPVAFLVCYDKEASWVRQYDGKSSGDIDASIVTTHMMLEAADLGLGSIWVMYWDSKKMKDEFSISQQYEPVALLIVGYAEENESPREGHFKRKSIEEIII